MMLALSLAMKATTLRLTTGRESGGTWLDLTHRHMFLQERSEEYSRVKREAEEFQRSVLQSTDSKIAVSYTR